MFKRVEIGEEMPDYYPDGDIANQILVIIWKLEVMEKSLAQGIMIDQLYYWGIQT